MKNSRRTQLSLSVLLFRLFRLFRLFWQYRFVSSRVLLFRVGLQQKKEDKDSCAYGGIYMIYTFTT